MSNVEIGQRWRSRDPRDKGLIATVLRVEPTQVQIQRFRKTWVNRDRFVRHYRLLYPKGRTRDINGVRVLISYPVPLEGDVVGNLRLPKDMTRDEAERVCAMVESLTAV